MRRLLSLFCAFTCALLTLSSCSNAGVDGGQTATQTNGSSSDTSVASSPTVTSSESKTTDNKWSVGQQLVQGKEWGSEGQPLAELEANVKESENTPDMRLILALKDLAGWYRGQKKYDEAEKIYRRIADMEGNRLGLKPGEIPWNDLGVLYTDMEKYDQAEDQFKRLIARWEVGERPTEMSNDIEATQRHNYAVLLEKTGRAGEAKEMEAKADALMKAKADALMKLSQPQ
jgi:tetratricopeptide (TPR) repeat protein